MGIEEVRSYFQTLGLADRIIEFDQSSETVDLAAKAVGVAPARIAKTMAFLVGDQPILIVIAGDARIANPAYKDRFGTKAKMIATDDVEGLIGHEVGGVCPFAIKSGVRVYLDESLKRFESVFPAAGSGNSAIELSIPELESYAKIEDWVDVCKNWHQKHMEA